MTKTTDQPGSRERLLAAAVQLLRTKGPTASGTKELLDTADAPRGSFYFHFPEGKDQLVAEAVALAAEATGEAITAALDDRSVGLPDRVHRVFVGIADGLLTADYRLGCAVGVTTLETAATTPALRAVTEAAFASWAAILVEHFVEEGLAPARAAALADSVIAGMEGATMLARARQDTTPLQHVATILRAATAAELTNQDNSGR